MARRPEWEEHIVRAREAFGAWTDERRERVEAIVRADGSRKQEQRETAA